MDDITSDRTADVPLSTVIVGNSAHDLGVWQKQSSLLFQAIAAKTVLRGDAHVELVIELGKRK